MSEPKIKLVWRKIDELVPYEHNAKLHPQEQIDKLVGSFDEFGRIVPAGIDRDGNLIYGHGRILAARQRGDTDFPCIEIDGLSETQRRAFVHADNLLAESGTDEEILRAEMQALQAAGFNVAITGFDPEGLQLGTEAQLEKISEDDYEPAPPEEPRTQRGQIWQLGDHLLMCGDAASATDMQVCVGGGQKPVIVFTDPPYGVSIGDKNKALAALGFGGGIQENIAGDTLSAEALCKMLTPAFTNLRQAAAEDCSYYVTSPQGGDLGQMMMMMMREAGLPVRHILIWVKNAPTFSMGRLDYDYKHEPVFYTWTKAHHFYGDYANTVIDDSKPLDKMDKGELKALLRAKMQQSEESVIYCDKPAKSKLHPTMKPIKLIARFLINSSRPGDVCADPFGGSGSTLIACEQLGRKCRMMEIDPHYCDVIIDRWEQFTGKKAVLLNG